MRDKKKDKNDGSQVPFIMKRKKSDAIAEALAFPADTFRNFPCIQIRGNREIVIEGCGGLLSYDAENILLETRFCKISIAGRKLDLQNLAAGVISIKGFIQKLEFNM